MAVFDLMPFTFRLSGGVSNTDPNASIGGAMSTDNLYSNTAVYAAGSIPGITLKGGNFMASGTGQLRFTAIGETLAWKEPGGSVFGPEFNVGVGIDGVGNVAYLGTEDWGSGIGVPGALLAIEVDIASLGVVDTTVDVTVGQDSWKLFNDVTESESNAGTVKYRGLYIVSNYGFQIPIGFLANAQPPGAEFISFSLAGLPNTDLETLADEYAEPTASEFSLSTDTVLFGGVAGDYLPVWVRQEIPALNAESFTDYRIQSFATTRGFWAGLEFASSVALSKYTLAYFAGLGKTITYSVVLEGTPNLELNPVYFTLNKYAAKYSIKDQLAVSIVALDIDTEEIYNRRNNPLKVVQTITYENGSSQSTTIDGMVLVAVENYGGGINRTILLKGERQGDYQSGTIHKGLKFAAIEGQLNASGDVTLVIPQVEALNLEPGQSVEADGVIVRLDKVSISIRSDSAVARVTRVES